MRVGLFFLAAAIGWAAAVGAEPGRHRGRVDLDIVVPVDPHEHERLYWFGRQDHHLVPGTVTIDQAPYVCDAHRRPFAERDAFVAHLRSAHGLASEAIPDALVVEDGIVHFSAPPPRNRVDSR